MEARKIQHVGQSTLTVSLPRQWAREAGLKPGDVVSFEPEDDGSLRLIPGMAKQEAKGIRCTVDADQCSIRGLLSRVITGTYITGHETIQIRSRKDLTTEHLEEIRRAARRLTGVSIVEQTLNQVTLQSFLDPTRFPVDGLIRRLSAIISSMQDAAFKALGQKRKELAEEIPNMEDEVDRIYWLVVRQLLLAIRHRDVAAKIGVKSPMHIAGNRVVVKTLENIADLIEGIGKEILGIIQLGDVVDDELVEKVISFGNGVHKIYENVVKALFTLDLKLANDCIERAEEAEREEKGLIETILSRVSEEATAARRLEKDALKQISLVVGLRSIVRNLCEMAKYCNTIAEVIINRTLEQPSKICGFEIDTEA